MTLHPFWTVGMVPPSELHDHSETRRSLLDVGHSRLKAADRDAPRRAAEWMLTDVLGCDRGQLHTHPDSPVSPTEAEQFREMVARYERGEPLQHVLGYTSFRGLEIEVSPAVMIPRPETEELVDHALEKIAGQKTPRVLDLGTGSGCIALAIKAERPDAQIQAWDVSAEALDVARSNADRLGLDVHFSQADLFEDKLGRHLEAPVTLLVSNPPYIPRDEAEILPAVVREYDPDIALFSGDDPLRFYRAIGRRAPELCASGAAVVLETHAEYADDAATELRAHGLSAVCIEEDLSGRPRVLTARYDPADPS